MRRSGPLWLAGVLFAGLLFFSIHAAEAHSGNRVVRRPPPASVAIDATEPVAPPAAVSVLPKRVPPAVVAGASTPLSPWLGVATALALAGVILRRSRRLVVWAVALLLAVFIAESSVHSVHHLTDPRGAAHCQVLSLVQHLLGNAAACPTVGSVPTDEGPVVVTLANFPRSDVPLRPDRGRAPPDSS